LTYTWYDFAGNVGVAMMIVAYLLLQLRRLGSTDLLYSVLNISGAALVLVSLWLDFNLSAFIIELFWIAISLIGITRWMRSERRGI
jgi:hypothetical protein